MIIAGVVAINDAGRHVLIQRTGNGYLKTPMTARSALMQLGAQATLVGARAEASLPRPSICGGMSCSCIDWAALGARASLYGGHAAVWGVRERSSQGNRFTSEDATYSDRENKLLSCTDQQHKARSKE